MGAADCDNMLMLLALPKDLPPDQRQIVTKEMMRGFAVSFIIKCRMRLVLFIKECAQEAGSRVRGGQTVFNPWLTIGGVASSICTSGEFIMPNSATKGDVLVLTKPLGTQVNRKNSG